MKNGKEEHLQVKDQYLQHKELLDLILDIQTNVDNKLYIILTII